MKIIKTLGNRVLLDLVFGITIPIIITFMLLSPLLIWQGIPFYGDETWYLSPSSCYWYTKLILYLWMEGRGAIVQAEFPRMIIIPFLTFFLGLEITVKIYVLLVPSLAGVLTYFALRILSKEWELFRDEIDGILFSFLGALFMLLPFTNIGLIGAATAPAWSYVMLPLSFALYVRYLKYGSFKNLALLCVTSIFAIANPFWVYLITVMAPLYLMITFSRRDISTVLKRLVMVALFLLAFDAFLLIPTLTGYLRGSGGIFQAYTAERLISFESLRFLSHWRLLDVLMVGEHQYYFFWLHPQNYGPLNAVLPVLAGSSLLAFRRNRYLLFMGLVLAIGVFLTKGVHEPAGHLYYLVAKSIPYGAGALLRNPTKFVPLVSFSYAFLISLIITKLYERAKSLKPLKAWSSKIASYGVALGLTLLVLAPVTYGTILDLQRYTWLRYKPTYIPEAYDELNSWLSNQPGDFKVMWIPSGGAYFWKPYIMTAFPDLYSSRPAVSFSLVYPQPLRSTYEVGKLLKALGVKYVIYHGDSLDYPNQEILQQLLKQRDLKVVYELNYTYTPEDDSKAPLPVSQPDHQFLQSPFKLLAPEFLPRGEEAEVVIQYTIPRSLVEEGFKGRFWAGFSIGLSGFPAGSASLDRRIFWAEVYEQRMINETCGYAVFKVKVPYTYPGTAIDIYANFYDGSYRPLTPPYFIARLLVLPREVRIPFVVFENEEYSGPVYLCNLTLAYGSSSTDLISVDERVHVPATLLSFRQVSPVEWEVVVNASGPFVLVFTEPYDRLWRAYVNGKEVEPVKLYELVNGFPISETGVLHIRIYYTLQMYYNIGLLISGLSFTILTLLSCLEKVRNATPPRELFPISFCRKRNRNGK